VFDEPIALPEGPPWKIGFMGRLDIEQKNLDTILHAFRRLRRDGLDVELHFHGGGQEEELAALSEELGVHSAVTVHGAYDHRTDLRDIVANGHVFLYTSRYEGGPCFTLLELMQAGRYVVASPVGGIPDIYDGHPEAGLLVDPDSPDAIAATIKEALEKIQEGRVNPSVIRKRYLDEFDIQSAHTAWMRALNLNGASA
jgi:glycosyltransferase involved in cell wall biosynthesis